MELKQELIAYMQKEIEQLNANDKVKEAMAYSLISNGKMIRPLIFLHSIRSEVNNVASYYPIAMAIEMIHVYSLIHDDLPAMDNDDLRRGKPTNHVVFGEDIAILAGDALLTHSFEQLLKAPLNTKQKVKLVQYTVDAAGVNQGMINGQVEDILNEKSRIDVTVEQLSGIHRQKTARLIGLPLICGEIVKDKEENVEKINKLATDFGIAFQIRDDYLDLYGDEELIGKQVGKDRENNKETYVDFYTKEELEEIINSLTNSVISIAKELNLSKDLIEIFKKLEKRKS